MKVEVGKEYITEKDGYKAVVLKEVNGEFVGYYMLPFPARVVPCTWDACGTDYANPGNSLKEFKRSFTEWVTSFDGCTINRNEKGSGMWADDTLNETINDYIEYLNTK